MTYSFRHVDGTVSTVKASNEDDARHLAMVLRWGPAPDVRIGVNGSRYRGQGLDLVSVSVS